MPEPAAHARPARRRAVSPVPWTVAALLVIIAGLAVAIVVVAQAGSDAPRDPAEDDRAWTSVYVRPPSTGRLEAGPIMISGGPVRIVLTATGPAPLTVLWGPEGDLQEVFSAETAQTPLHEALDVPAKKGPYHLVVETEFRNRYSIEVFQLAE